MIVWHDLKVHVPRSGGLQSGLVAIRAPVQHSSLAYQYPLLHLGGRGQDSWCWGDHPVGLAYSSWQCAYCLGPDGYGLNVAERMVGAVKTVLCLSFRPTLAGTFLVV